MDVSTSLVQAYLHINGYLTATDYPLIQSRHDQPSRTLTDVDMLAVRFGRHAEPGPAPKLGKGTGVVSGPVVTQTDPELKCRDDQTDMIISEIKQGRAQVNPGSRNQQVLAATLIRFGCCNALEAPALVQKLLQNGRARAQAGHVLRMVLFASRGDHAPRGWHWVHIDHVLLYLDKYLREESNRLGGVDLHDPALSWLTLLQKCGLQLQSSRDSS